MTTILEIRTTTDTASKAQILASKLVEHSLAACVQIDGPIQSVYRWQEKIESASEWRLSCKTTLRNRDRLIARIRELHDYDVPEILCLRVTASEDYAVWVAESCHESSDGMD
jgi:periplasmic divalent cation tolerance protein